MQVPVDSRGREGLRPISTPVAIEVRDGPDGEPVEVRAGNRWHRVAHVEDTWSFDLWWMPRPLTRTYYRVSREDGTAAHPLPGPQGRLLVQATRLVTRGPAVTAGYVELHAKSFYSFGMGASHAHEMLSKAVELGYPALALTDTNLCGALEFARLAGSLGVQPVTGGELTLMDGSRLVMLAKTREGYANISRLFTLANSEDRRKPRLDPALVREYADGVVLLTGGRGGPLAKLLSGGRREDARALLVDYLEWYGAGSVYVELQQNLLQGDTERNRESAMIAGEVGVPVVATNDALYHSPGEVQAPARPGRSRPQHHHRPGTTIHQPQPPPAHEIAGADGAPLQGLPGGHSQHH